MSARAVVIWRVHQLNIQNGSLAWLSVDPGFHLGTPLVTEVPTAMTGVLTKSHSTVVISGQFNFVNYDWFPPEQPEKRYMVGYYLASEVTQSNWCCTALIEAVTRSTRFKGKEHRPSLSMGEMWTNVDIKLQNHDIKKNDDSCQLLLGAQVQWDMKKDRF